MTRLWRSVLQVENEEGKKRKKGLDRCNFHDRSSSGTFTHFHLLLCFQPSFFFLYFIFVLETQQGEGNFIYSLNLKKKKKIKLVGFFPPFLFQLPRHFWWISAQSIAHHLNGSAGLPKGRRRKISDENWMKRGTPKEVK